VGTEGEGEQGSPQCRHTKQSSEILAFTREGGVGGRSGSPPSLSIFLICAVGVAVTTFLCSSEDAKAIKYSDQILARDKIPSDRSHSIINPRRFFLC
jgi:hypothetical protein